MEVILEAIWFFLPAGVSNMMPVVAAKAPVIKNWDWPISTKHFGKNKTYRGIILGTLVAMLLVLVQYKLTPEFYENLIPGISAIKVALIGALLGFGALFGDIVESYFKRLRGTAPGESWLPFDQIDYVLGAIIFSLPVVQLTLLEYALIISIFFGLHIIIVYVFYKLGIRERPI
ncbi:MAG: CDP-archaeol synthase [bacterium]|nr:CDP-archaeol synthase [bacterium]